ncbi:unnamed protein product [Calypogeia fissa]
MTLSKLLSLMIVVFGSLATASLSDSSIEIACHDFIFNVSTVSFNDSGVIQPAATYSISATHCPPTKFVHHRASTVQFLVHGATVNKLYWSALAPVGSITQYQPWNYSYVDFARGEGYHTIAIDRLGAGNSSHPDPTLVRAGLEAEQTNTIIEQIRRNNLHPFLPPCEKLILVGHSYGSFIANIMLDKYPRAVEGAILTGFVHVFSNAVSAVGQQQTAPAREVFPKEFGNLDPGYLTHPNQTNQRQWFYGADGSFDPKVAATQFSREDVQAIGELNSINSVVAGPFFTEKSRYTGPLAVMMGEQDGPFCYGDCGRGNSSLIALSKPFWPNVSRYTGFLMKNTGHLLQYHYSARKGFELLHEWLETSGF